jgi:AAA ATPase domain
VSGTSELGLPPDRRRASELVFAALTSVTRRQPRIVVVSGEAGIGKTFLAESISQQALAMGVERVVGRCQDDWTAPFAPWRQVLDGLECRDVDWDESGDDTLDVRAAQRRRTEEVAGTICRVVNDRPALVVLEDLHWADDSSLRCLEVLARSLTTEQLLVLATCRDERNPDVSRTIAALTRSDHYVRVELEPLGSTALAHLASQHAARELDDGEIAMLRARTGGNPLYVIELARWFRRHPGDDRVPASINDIVQRRLVQLPIDVEEVLTTAAVIGATFDLDVLAGVTDLERDALFDLVDVATLHRLVEPDPDRSNYYRFTHAIVRDAVAQGVPPLRRARLHHRIADVTARVAPNIVDVAVHRWEARAAAPELARGACRQAALVAEAAYASTDATTWWERALALEPSDGADRPELLLKLGRSLERVGSRVERDTDPPIARATTGTVRSSFGTVPHSSWWYLEQAVDEALRHDDLDTAAAAASAFGYEWDGLPWAGFRFTAAGALQRIETVLERLPTERVAQRARLMSKLGVGLYASTDVSTGDTFSDEGLRLARRDGDPRLLATALLSRAQAIHRPGRDADQLELLGELSALQPLAPEHRAAALIMRCNLHIRGARRDDAERDLEQARRLGRERGLDWAERQSRLLDSVLAIIDGEPETAETILAEVARTMQRQDTDNDVLAAGEAQARIAIVYGLRFAQGRLAELESTLLPATQLKVSHVDVLGPVLTALGRTAEARALAISAATAPEPPYDGVWFFDTTLRAHLAIGTGDVGLARLQYTRLAPYTGCVAIAIGMIVFEPVDQTLGDLARTLGDTSLAITHYRAAVDISERMRAPVWRRRAMDSLDAIAVPGDGGD